MSMTVHITTGCTDLEVLKEALEEMGIRTEPPDVHRAGRRRLELSARIHGRNVGFARGSDGNLELVGDQEWEAVKDRQLHRQIRQTYATVNVRRNAEALGYRVASVTKKQDGTISMVVRAWR